MSASDASAQIGQTLTWRGGLETNWLIRQNWSPEEVLARGADLVKELDSVLRPHHRDAPKPSSRPDIHLLQCQA